MTTDLASLHGLPFMHIADHLALPDIIRMGATDKANHTALISTQKAVKVLENRGWQLLSTSFFERAAKLQEILLALPEVGPNRQLRTLDSLIKKSHWWLGAVTQDLVNALQHQIELQPLEVKQILRDQLKNKLGIKPENYKNTKVFYEWINKYRESYFYNDKMPAADKIDDLKEFFDNYKNNIPLNERYAIFNVIVDLLIHISDKSVLQAVLPHLTPEIRIFHPLHKLAAFKTFAEHGKNFDSDEALMPLLDGLTREVGAAYGLWKNHEFYEIFCSIVSRLSDDSRKLSYLQSVLTAPTQPGYLSPHIDLRHLREIFYIHDIFDVFHEQALSIEDPVSKHALMCDLLKIFSYRDCEAETPYWRTDGTQDSYKEVLKDEALELEFPRCGSSMKNIPKKHFDNFLKLIEYAKSLPVSSHERFEFSKLLAKNHNISSPFRYKAYLEIREWIFSSIAASHKWVSDILNQNFLKSIPFEKLNEEFEFLLELAQKTNFAARELILEYLSEFLIMAMYSPYTFFDSFLIDQSKAFLFLLKKIDQKEINSKAFKSINLAIYYSLHNSSSAARVKKLCALLEAQGFVENNFFIKMVQQRKNNKNLFPEKLRDLPKLSMKDRALLKFVKPAQDGWS